MLDQNGTLKEQTSGSIALAVPRQLRWEYETPFPQLIVADGEHLFIYDPDLEQVTIQNLDQRLSQTPALLLSGDISKISESFSITHKEGGNIVDFFLKPKAKDSLFDTLRLSFRDGVINDMQLLDTIGQRTNILFREVKMNQPLDAAQFNFEVPPGADVIEE